MRSVISLLFLFLLFAGSKVNAQSCFSTGLNGTVVNLPCNVNCTQMKFKVPHLKSSSDYTIVSIPYNPLPFVTSTGTELTSVYIDDVYSSLITLPFPFCFYDSVYNNAVVGSNGIITFDEFQANKANAYPITQTIPYAGGSPNQIAPAYYPPASVMGAYSDLDPRANESPSDRKIEWRVEGTAPCRKFVVSYYHVGVFGNTSCGLSTPNTFQMILYESTGVIDVVFQQKACFPSTDGGNAILGVQNWQRNKAVAAPGRNATHWSENNTAFRFIPSGPVSRFIKAELLDINGVVLATTGVTQGADTATTTPGILDLNFPQQCPTALSTPYIVKTYFGSCTDASQMFSLDTITVVKTASLNATTTSTPAACGPNGSIVVNIPAGAGTPPYLISLDGSLPVSEPGQTHTFSGLTGGAHTVQITTAGGCSQLLNVTVATSGTLTVTTSVTATSCSGAANGSIVITPQNGVAPHQYSLNGGITWQTSSSFTGLPAGSYILSAKDNSGCVLQNLIINVPLGPPITATMTVVPPACPGAANGRITVNTPAGGLAPYTYQINNTGFQSNNVFTGLPTGTYFVSVRDAQGCAINNMLVSVPAGTGTLQATATTNNTSCAGANNGSINISSTNGNAPYQYSLDNGTTWISGNVIPNLAPGSYTFLVKDNGGCVSAPLTATVSSGGALLATANATAASCNAVSDGVIVVTPTTGSGHTFQLDGGPAQSSNTFNNVSAGTHTIIVHDAAGCISAPISVTVGVATQITGTATSNATTCNGATNGSIVITPSVAGIYTFSLDGGTFQTGNVFNNISAGNHTVVIKTTAGCLSAPISVSVAAGPPLTGSVTSSPTTCSGVNNGAIQVLPGTGTAPFQYALDGSTVFQTANSFTGVAAGAHTVIIKDASGCTSASLPVTVSVGPPLTGSANGTPTSCSGAVDGVITVIPSGSGSFTYQLDGGSFQPSAVFNNVSAGTHSVVIRESSGCLSAPINVTVAAGTVLSASVVTTPTSCSGAINGTITVMPVNTSGVYQYSLDGITFQSSNIFTGLNNGNYTITFKNNIGCQATVNATVSPGQPLTATTNVSNVSCNGGNNGTVSISISTNGAPPYQFSLDGGTTWQNSPVFSGLTAGSYTVSFKDNNNCSGTQGFTITQPALLTIAPAEQAVLCNGQSNGTIVIAASGGTSPYRYSIDGINYQGANNFNVAAGNYTVYVKDNNNCIKSQPVTISQPQVLSASSLTSNSTCAGNDGTLTLSANGGTGNYSYSINGTNFQASNIFNVGPGNYTAIIKDVNGCMASVKDTVRLTNTLYVVPVADTVTCEGVGVKLQPNTNATQFAWLPAPGLSGYNIAQPTATPTVTTDYILVAALGICTANDTITVNVNPAPIADAGADGDICFGQTYQLQGNGGVIYEWSPGTYFSGTTSDNHPVVAPAQTIQYSLYVTDANQCRSLQPDMVTVHVTPPIVVIASRDTSAALGDQFQLHAASVATDYSWSPVTGLSDSKIPNPIVTISGDITYTVTATTSAGCKGEASVTIKVYEGPAIYVPTAFTPNQDGRNDLFTPFPVGIKQYTYFRIFNRWGQEIFSTTSFGVGWDGKMRGKEQPTGSYVWMIEGITKDGKKISKRGTVTLIR